MKPALRPMSLGEILDRTFEIYRKNVLLFAGIAALPALAMLLVNLANQFWWKSHPAELARLFGLYNIGVPIYLLKFFYISTMIDFLFYPSLTDLCARLYTGESSSLRLSLYKGFGDFRKNIGYAVLQTGAVLIFPQMICFILLIVTVAIEATFNIDTSELGIAFAPTILFFSVAGVSGYFWMWSCTGLGWAVQNSEDLTAIQAARRSFLLTSGRRRSIFVAQLVPIAIRFALTIAFGILTSFIYLNLRHESWASHKIDAIYDCSTFLGQLVINTAVCPIIPIIMTLIYYDQRVRKEGYDVEVMMAAAGWTAPVATEPGESLPEPHPAEPVADPPLPLPAPSIGEQP